MSILTGSQILEELNKGIIIRPYHHENLTNNGYDLTLSKKIWVQAGGIKTNSNVISDDSIFEEVIIPDEGYVVIPHTLYIGRSNEYIESLSFIPKIAGKSSLARCGISVCMDATAGDIGYAGHWTLEIINHTLYPYRIYANMPICRLELYTPYGTYCEIHRSSYMGTSTDKL